MYVVPFFSIALLLPTGGSPRCDIVDADVTAKSILTLNLLGRPISADQLIEVFESENHFRTWTAAESKLSFSVNWNVLNCLLSLNQPPRSLKSETATPHGPHTMTCHQFDELGTTMIVCVSFTF